VVRSTRLLELPDGGAIEYLDVGDGEPRTLFAHGLAGSIDDVRPLAGGVGGTRVFAHMAGHGRTRVTRPVEGYPALAGHLRAVLDHTKADRALGVSLGSATLLRLMVETPDRLARAVIYLPSVFDHTRAPAAVRHHRDLAAALTAHDRDGVVRALLTMLPAGARASVPAERWAAGRAADLLAGDGDPAAWAGLAEDVPVADRNVLAAVSCPVLVIAQQGDEVHPVGVAEEIAGSLPGAELRVFDATGALWGHRRELRALVSGFLNAT
jgi:pimeloyl-ACP methyl ester carboxylesterase